MPVNDSVAVEQYMRFRYMAERGHLEFLQKADKCDNFFLGMQWEEADLNALKLARRPAMTINKIISTISTIQGEQIYNRNEVLFRPRKNAKTDTAEALTKVWMQIAQNNQLPWVRSDVFASGIIRSRGFYDVRLGFDDAMRGEVHITQLNSKNVVVDPDAEEYDPDSWADVITSKWLTPQDIAILYSEDDAEYLSMKDGSAYLYGYDSIERVRDRFAGTGLTRPFYGLTDEDRVRRNVRVLDRQYRRLDKRNHFVDVVTGDARPVPEGWDRNKIAAVLEKAGGQLNVIKKLVKRIRWCVTADDVVLHDDWSPYKHFTVVGYFPQFLHGKTTGIVEHLLGPQEILNKVSSQELHIINTTANSGWKLKKGALTNMSIEELEQWGAKTGLVLELDDVAHAEKIQPNQTPTGLDRISYKAEEHIKTISNVSDSMQGFDREDVAAKAIAYKQQRGSVNMTKVLDNLERTDYILARNVLDLVQEFYTEERLINITRDDVMREPEEIVVNQLTAEGEIVNDLTLGEYGIVVISTPYRASMEDSQFEQARALRELGIPIPDSVLIENSRLMRRSEIVKQMTADKESPEAQQQAELALRSQAAEVSKAEAEVDKTLADTELQRARTLKEAQEAQGGDGAEMEKLRIEEETALREHELERWKMEQEFALKREAMQQEMALKREQHAQELEIRRQEAEQEAQLRREDRLAQRAQQLRESGTSTPAQQA